MDCLVGDLTPSLQGIYRLGFTCRHDFAAELNRHGLKQLCWIQNLARTWSKQPFSYGPDYMLLAVVSLQGNITSTAATSKLLSEMQSMTSSAMFMASVSTGALLSASFGGASTDNDFKKDLKANFQWVAGYCALCALLSTFCSVYTTTQLTRVGSDLALVAGGSHLCSLLTLLLIFYYSAVFLVLVCFVVGCSTLLRDFERRLYVFLAAGASFAMLQFFMLSMAPSWGFSIVGVWTGFLGYAVVLGAIGIFLLFDVGQIQLPQLVHIPYVSPGPAHNMLSIFIGSLGFLLAVYYLYNPGPSHNNMFMPLEQAGRLLSRIEVLH